ncbi:MAG: DNA polymerase III subunit beta, partial [Deltaproteobacteria bacterium]|nr:DNA polymerase III subunit beta [Deltaproteobacteria bacterium]
EGGARLRFVATDSHRLSYAEIPLKGSWRLEKGVIIPRKGVLELRRLLDEAEGEVQLIFTEKQLFARREQVTLMIRLIDGQFPPYQQVVPKDQPRLVAVNREELSHALRRAQIVTTDRSRGVTFAVSSGHLKLTVNNPDIGEVEEELSIGYKGEALKWAVNGRYLSDVLATVQDEQVILELKNEVSPCVIRSEFDKGFLAVIMPMRV